MADEGGVSAAEVNHAIDALRSQLRSEFRTGLLELERELQNEVRRLEEEMKEVGELIVGALQQQTEVMVTGLAATTTMIESAKVQSEEDFQRTRNKLDEQIEKIDAQTQSGLQMEIGKKVAEATAIQDKMQAFAADIKSRFDRAIITSQQNRELYNVAFRNLTEEFESKIRTIGAHIFEIRVDDIAPAFKAASVPYEEAHGLPLEMDLKRLEMRSLQLDGTLELLKDSRLDDVVSSMDRFDRQLASAALNAPPGAADEDYCVEGVATRSQLTTTLCAGVTAQNVNGSLDVAIGPPAAGLEVFALASALAELGVAMDQASSRPVTNEERARLANAARGLRQRGFISEDALRLFDDFLASGALAVVGV